MSVSVTELFLCRRCDPQFQNPKGTLMEAQNKTKVIEAEEQMHMSNPVLSFIIPVAPLQVPPSLYNKGRLINFQLRLTFLFLL